MPISLKFAENDPEFAIALEHETLARHLDARGKCRKHNKYASKGKTATLTVDSGTNITDASVDADRQPEKPHPGPAVRLHCLPRL